MRYVTEELTKPGVSGTTPEINDVITKVFHAEDPRSLVINITGSLTNFRLQGKTGDGSWRTIATQAAGTRLVFVGPFETVPDLLDDQLRVIALAATAVTKVFVSRMM